MLNQLLYYAPTLIFAAVVGGGMAGVISLAIAAALVGG